MVFVFTCRERNPDHAPQRRPRMHSGHGTKNLIVKVSHCIGQQFVTSQQASGPSASRIPYSKAAHRALIALRCVKGKRPFYTVKDPDYLAEVEMLRPGTVVPSPTTVARDVHTLYRELSIDVRQYFLVSSLNIW